jgi:hypothetical protein
MDSLVVGSARVAGCRFVLGMCVLAAGLIGPAARPAPGQAAISSTSQRPFVIGFIPVVGPGGAVGGVSVDAKGVVARSDVDAAGKLREVRLKALARLDSDVNAASPMRKISLRGIQAAIDELRQEKLPLTDELQNLAGVQRIEYVFVFPEQRDIVLAGPAEGWKISDQGTVVGTSTGQSVLQLDDLIVALRTAEAAATGRGITCSIDPTEEGLARFQRLLRSRGLAMNEATVARLEEAIGSQQITVTGVSPETHFAQVLVAADFLMKRLAMNLEAAPIADMPSYMEMLQGKSDSPRTSMPRFWLAPKYDPVLKDEEGLAWQLRGSGVQALTEDGYVSSSGEAARRVGKEEPLAKKWVETMTARYEELSAAAPIFGELRGCMDMAVVAALLTKEDLPGLAGCDLSLLLDEKQIAVAEYHAPKTIPSQASVLRQGRGWIVSISGGIDVNSWAVLEKSEVHAELATTRKAAMPLKGKRWWWD